MFYRKFALEFRTMGGNKLLMACILEMTFHLHIELLHAPEIPLLTIYPEKTKILIEKYKNTPKAHSNTFYNS